MLDENGSSYQGAHAAHAEWLGHWVQTRFDEEVFDRLLTAQGVPFPLRHLMKTFVGERVVSVDEDGNVVVMSKKIGFDLIKKMWSKLIVGCEPSKMEALGYCVEASVAWEEGGAMLVISTVTSSKGGLFGSAWSVTTRAEHHLVDGELVCSADSGDWAYRAWFTRQPEPHRAVG